MSGGAKALMSVDDAIAAMQDYVTAVTEEEVLPLSDCLGRVLAADQISPIDVPGFDNSAMDGWAVFRADLAEDGPSRLPVGGRIAAGHPLAEAAVPGKAYRIFTGAPVPVGPDAVIMQEQCVEADGFVTLPKRPKLFDNIRKAGESVSRGGIPLMAGIRLGPQHLGVAATIGLSALPVIRPLRVAIFSSGDEVREPGQPLPPGAIYDANRHSLRALLQGLGTQVSDLGILPDRLEVIQSTLARAAKDHDLIITSGGVSVGEEDHIKTAVSALGELHLWRLALKPGKPLALGRVDGVAFLGLPGNPVAVMVAFLLFGRPLLDRLSGAVHVSPRRYPLAAGFALSKKPGRREFPRARVTYTVFGPVVELHTSDSSGVLTSMTSSDGLLDLAAEGVEIAPGDMVPFIPFAELLA